MMPTVSIETLARALEHHHDAIAELRLDPDTMEGVEDLAAATLRAMAKRHCALRDDLRKPFCSVFLSGGNEHGSRVLILPGDNVDEVLREFVESEIASGHESGLSNRIIRDAEALGYRARCHAVVTLWEARLEYAGVSAPLTEAMHGTPEEQDAPYEAFVAEQRAEEERHRLETTAMVEHFTRHPHG